MHSETFFTALILSIVMLLTGCGQVQPQTAGKESEWLVVTPSNPTIDFNIIENSVPEYGSLDDANLLSYVEDLVYRDTVNAIDSRTTIASLKMYLLSTFQRNIWRKLRLTPRKISILVIHYRN